MARTLPPYGKDVAAARLRPGHKLLLFAGAKAWNAARWYREGGAECERRHEHVLVLPPDQTARAQAYRWPVRGVPVIVVSVCENDAELLPLFDALQRDGARSIEVYACDPSIGSGNLEWELSGIHWGHLFADPVLAAVPQANAA